MLYLQDFSAYGFQEVLPGYKSFVSYGNKVGDVSFYLSYNHLENKAQPQSFHIGAPASGAESIQVSGAIAGSDQLGRDVMYYGDSGVIDSVTDNFKLKLGYDVGGWSALLNVLESVRDAVTVFLPAFGSGVNSVTACRLKAILTVFPCCVMRT